MPEMKAGLGPVAKDGCDTLVLELTNESAFYDALYVLIKARSRNSWVGKASVSKLVRTTIRTVRTITKLKAITPTMMEYIYQALMREYQEEMDDIYKEQAKLTGKSADFLVVDDLMAEDLPSGDERFIKGQSRFSGKPIYIDMAKAEERVAMHMQGRTIGVSAGYRTTDNIPRRAGSFHDEEVFYASGDSLPKDMYSEIAKETGKDRNQVKADFFAMMYGASSKTINKINGEPKMNFNTKPFENVNYDLIYGCKPKDLTESQLLEAIKHLEDEISTLEDINAKSVTKDKRIQDKRDSIDKIVEELDSRIEKETK